MIHINLLPVREVEQAVSRRKELMLAGGGVVVTLLAVVLVHLMQVAQLGAAGEKLAQMEGAIAKIRKQNQDLEKIRQQRKELEEKIRVVRLLTSPERRAAAVHVLDDLSASTPELLWLTDFTESRGNAKINGRAVDNQTIAAFAHNLSNSQYFQKIEIRETSQEVQTADQRRRIAAGRAATAAEPTPSIPVTKFLIEATVSYQSIGLGDSVTEGEEQAKAENEGGKEGKKATERAKEKK